MLNPLRLPRRLGMALTLGSAALLAACNGSSSDDTNAAASPGTLVSSRTLDRSPLAAAERAYALTYQSTTVNGKTVVPVQGVLALPKGPTPNGGFPVLSWASGTTGVAPQCSPLTVPNADRDTHLNAWLNQGYAVLMTDYYGWGDQGLRPDNHGASNAAAMYDLVAAAHALPDIALRKEWIAIGHSQGGGASLWAAGTQAGKTYPLRGAIALAPTGPGVLQFMDGILQGAPAGPAAPFISVSVLAAQVVDPGITLDSVVTPDFTSQVERAREVCLDVLFALPELPAGNYLKPGAGYERLARAILGNDPSALTMQVPVLIAQGDKDETTVKPPSTKKMMNELCSKGADLEYHEYAGVSHRGVMDSAEQAAFQFADKVLKNQSISSNYCGK